MALTCGKVQQIIAVELASWFNQLEQDGVTTLAEAREERAELISDIAFQLINGSRDPVLMVHNCQPSGDAIHEVQTTLSDYVEGR